jgi:hypothetical protein
MNRALIWILIGSLAGLVWFSHRLAGIRIYQVDECQNVYVANILANKQTQNSYANLSLLQLPVSWVSRGATNSVDRFVSARFLMLEVFWLNVVLIALATGEKLISIRGLIALLGAATLAPLWDYGFEIRHDNLLLTCLLLMWCVLRVKPAGAQSYFIAGALAMGMQFVAFKAFVYSVPISVAILLFPSPENKSTRWRLVLAWVAGALAVFGAVRFIYGSLGLWDLFLSDFRRVSQNATGGARFWPIDTLARMPVQLPLLLALVAVAVVGFATDLLRRGKAALNWNGCVPEAYLFLVILAGLMINPAPYPYNAIHLVAAGFLFAYRYVSTAGVPLWNVPVFPALALAVVVFTHFVPFGMATRRHLSRTNYRQEQLMRLAENLTEAGKDPVYDGIGLVPSRPSIHFKWFLEALNLQSFIKGPGAKVREMLAARPAAVIVPNYRTDWLPEEDHDFIRQRYVLVADDFLVLGKVLSEGGGSFEIHHAGRYRISTLKGSDLDGTYPVGFAAAVTPEDPGSIQGTLDGSPLTDQPVNLPEGTHRIECAPDCQPAVVWVGPHLNRIHRIGPGDHKQLFVNWY